MSKPKLNVLCSIAARAGSKGIPGKNLKLLGDRPLLAYALRAATESQCVDRLVLNTDDEVLADVGRQYGAEVPFLRPASLGGDRVPLISVSQHTMQMMDEENFRADVVIQLAPTCPFISSERIAQSVELISEYDCDSAVSLQRIEHSHPYRARILDEDGYFDNYISDIDIESIHSRQDLPVLYCTSGGLYTRKRELLEQYDGADFALGEKRKGIVVDDYEAINIDRPIDFEFAEFLVGNGHVEHLISK